MTKIRLISLMLIAVLIIGIMLIIYNEVMEINMDFHQKTMVMNCKYASYILNKLFRDSRNFLELTSKYPIIMNLSLKHLEPFLLSLVQKFDIFNSVYVIDKKGKTLIDATHVPELFDGVPSQVWFTNVIKGHYSDYTTGVYKSAITKRYAITQAVLIRGPVYDLRAVLAAEIDMTYLWEQVTKFLPDKEKLKIYLLNEKNEIIYGENGTIPDADKKDFFNYTGISENAFKSRLGSFQSSSDNSYRLGAYCSLRSIDEIKGMNWKIVLIKEYGSMKLTENISSSGFLNMIIYMVFFVLILIILNFIFLYFGVFENENN